MTNSEFRTFVIKRGLLPVWVSTCQILKDWGVRTSPAEFRENLAYHRVHEFLRLCKLDPLYVKRLDRAIIAGARISATIRPLINAKNVWEGWERFGLYGMGYPIYK